MMKLDLHAKKLEAVLRSRLVELLQQIDPKRAVKCVVVWHDVITCGVFERCGIFGEASIGACRDRHLSEAKLVEGTTDKPSSCARGCEGSHCAFAMNEVVLL